MNRRILALLGAPAAALALAAVAPGSAGAAAPSAAHNHGTRVCALSGVPAGSAACDAVRLDDANGSPVNPLVTSSGGMTPADIQAAYGLTGRASGGRTVAIVDAYGYPNAASDLAVFRSRYALPPCTVANGCLTIVDQNGGTSLPRYNKGWAQEQALDLDAVSSACPDCRILLVQVSSASIANLGAGVTTAANRAGVVAISNSYGSSGDLPDSSYGAAYNHPGIAVTASTGDNGYQGASYPASSAYVTAVGGTTLRASTAARGWVETAWSGSGSGCSTLNAAPVGQTPAVTGCAKHAVADVSADADPNTGLVVYGPTNGGRSAWQQFGGTSLSSPIIASVYALSGNTAGNASSIPYAAASTAFNDVTSGTNGTCGAKLCTAGTGWDGPTGLGTPNGVAGL